MSRAEPPDEAWDRRTLLVVSVPFGRNARYILSSSVIEEITARYAVLVVSPFSSSPAFQKEFGSCGVRFFSFGGKLLSSNKLLRLIYAFSELLRFGGFYFRYRRRGMGRRLSAWLGGASGYKRVIRYVACVFGRTRRAWALLDRLLGLVFYDFASIRREFERHPKTVILHTASFGEQERFLHAFARRVGAKQILLPYTTDQIAINGHLMGEYDTVLSQGPFETRAAEDFHGLERNRVFPFGCIWFRNVEEWCRAHEHGGDARRTSGPVVLYVGTAETIIPRESEWSDVRALTAASEGGLLAGWRVVYRPLAVSDEDFERAIRPLLNSCVQFQRPQVSCFGMDGYTQGSVRDEIDEYLSQIVDVDVIVTAAMTSMALDACFLRKGIVASFTDPSGQLQRSGVLSVLEADNCGILASGLPVARDHDELVRMVAHLGECEEERIRIAQRVMAEWDYPRSDYERVLLDVLGSGDG